MNKLEQVIEAIRKYITRNSVSPKAVRLTESEMKELKESGLFDKEGYLFKIPVRVIGDDETQGRKHIKRVV